MLGGAATVSEYRVFLGQRNACLGGFRGGLLVKGPQVGTNKLVLQLLQYIAINTNNLLIGLLQ